MFFEAPAKVSLRLTGISSNQLYQYFSNLLELDRESKAAPADAGKVPIYVLGPRRKGRFRSSRLPQTDSSDDGMSASVADQ